MTAFGRATLALCALLSGCLLDRFGADVQVDPRDAGVVRIDATPTTADADGDGIADAIDSCPQNADPDQFDRDGDGLGDACDEDREGDGVPNALDVCPDQASDGTPDEDGDGLRDSCDNCPLDSNRTQDNADADRLGDACEDADPTRFSRVAFLATFRSSLDGVTTDGTLFADAGELELRSDGSERLLRMYPSPVGDYALHAVGRYLGREGLLFPSGSFGALLRWRDERGYRIGIDESDDQVEFRRRDGSTCGVLGNSECAETLLDTPLGLGFEGNTGFVLRATAYGPQLVLRFSRGGAVVSHQVNDLRYGTGDLGIWVNQANVRIGAIAVYAP